MLFLLWSFWFIWIAKVARKGYEELSLNWMARVLPLHHRSGVDSLEIDMDMQKVTVTGYVDKRRVLKLVRRTGRKAEFWPFPYDSEYYPYAAQYLDESNFVSSYNYYTHGHNESVHGYFPDLPYQTIDDMITYSFNEENVHACTIM
ncbi:heavy metal-associated isoprenylated plant protein 45 isoform X2 [Henckelia pumila]|uniref:heavy metal-associated isoprenylated plant protein 45 isoform X2 n=1 Tax=Henckelia pumila TaxID=405737 RepID=UPI003C6E0EC5